MAAIVIIYTLNLDNEISPEIKKNQTNRKSVHPSRLEKKVLLVTVMGQDDPHTVKLSVNVIDHLDMWKRE